MTPNRAFTDRSTAEANLECGSIRSSDQDDFILCKIYEALKAIQHRRAGNYNLTLNFADAGVDELDPRDLISERMESLHYRNFYDWNARLDRIDDWRYRLKTLGHNLEFSTRCFRRITDDRTSVSKIHMSVAIS